MELFRANYQWSTRPDDQRFTSLHDMRDRCKAYADNAREAETSWKDLRVEAADGNLRLVGKAGVPAVVSHYAFGQLAQRANAPAEYLRALPPTLAAQNANYGLAQRTEEGTARLLFHANDTLVLRAATGKVYERVWNWEVCDRLLVLESEGWTPPLPRPDLVIADDPRSNAPDLYASDHDMFAFLASPDVRIADGSEGGLMRGLIVTNSEVGDRSLGVMRFLYRYLCGNHIIWGAQDVQEIRLAHRGDIRSKFDAWQVEARRYLNESAREDEAKIETAKTTLIGLDKDQVLDKLFGIRSVGLSRKQLTAGYDAVVQDEDGDPRSVWGMVNGLTRASQATPYADQRTELDRAAGKVMSIAF
jgi:hypothetical protein